ncbi:hypothetical protein BDZ89DRAFT_1080464, partial [Hymenopellis radicata]
MSNIFVAGGTKPAKPATTALQDNGSVAIYHPDYEPPRLLLLLVAFCSPSGSYGVPFSVVLDAARIIANNSDGTLRVLGADADLTPPNEHSLLSPGKYEYRVRGGEPRYPICTSFRAWKPPNHLPSHWNVDVMGAKARPPRTVLKMTDGRCIVSGDISRLQSCHLVPEAETNWWIKMGMSGRTQNAKGINSMPNCLTMRADLNAQGMDLGHFVFAPYAGMAVCVCITDDLADFAAEHHLRAVNIPARIHPVNVYARFAWGLFQSMQNILCGLEQVQDVVTVAEQTTVPAISSPKRRCTEGTGGANVGLNEQESRTDGGA